MQCLAGKTGRALLVGIDAEPQAIPLPQAVAQLIKFPEPEQYQQAHNVRGYMQPCSESKQSPQASPLLLVLQGKACVLVKGCRKFCRHPGYQAL